jgi:tetratricopeptide repeat protein
MIQSLFTPQIIERSLRSRARAALFLLAVGAPSLALAGETVRVAIAASDSYTLSIAKMRMAVRLDPSNPGLHFRLGLADTYYLEGSNAEEGLEQLRQATELSPHRARYWSGLASACESLGETPCAERAIERTLSLCPMTPQYHWDAANDYLLEGRLDLALAQFRRLLDLDPGYAASTFPLCLKATGNPQIIDREVVTPAADPKLKLAYVDFLISQGQDGFASGVWKEVIARHAAFSFSSGAPYLEHLLQTGRAQEAEDAWGDLERLGVVKRPADQNAKNLVFNGGFEQAPLNAGFDWRYRQEPYLEIDFADPGAYEGARCLRLEFTVSENEEYEPVNQLAPVEANQPHVLTAWVRSQDITSDSGPRLRVVDPSCPACLDVSSETTVGTTSWHRITLSFSTGPQTQEVRLSVWRPRSRTFPTGITGSFWLDDVSLRLAPAPAPVTQATRRSEP